MGQLWTLLTFNIEYLVELLRYLPTCLNQTLHLGLGIIPSAFTLEKLSYYQIPNFRKFVLRSKLSHYEVTLNGFQLSQDLSSVESRCVAEVSLNALRDFKNTLTKRCENTKKYSFILITSEAEGRASFRWIWKFSQVERPTVTLFSVLYLLNQATDWQMVFGIWKPHSINHSY